MQEQINTSVVTLENQLAEGFGVLMSQTQLAELLGRSSGGFYIIREIEDSPHPELPDTAEPQTVEPGPANPAH
jgi:hypothetical protein